MCVCVRLRPRCDPRSSPGTRRAKRVLASAGVPGRSPSHGGSLWPFEGHGLPATAGGRDASTPHTQVRWVISDTQTDMLLGEPKSAICVQRFDDSLNSAIHTTYRSWLRSSSMREPRDPPSKVVNLFSSRSARRGANPHRARAQPSDSVKHVGKKTLAGLDGRPQNLSAPASDRHLTDLPTPKSLLEFTRYKSKT